MGVLKTGPTSPPVRKFVSASPQTPPADSPPHSLAVVHFSVLFLNYRSSYFRKAPAGRHTPPASEQGSSAAEKKKPSHRKRSAGSSQKHSPSAPAPSAIVVASLYVYKIKPSRCKTSSFKFYLLTVQCT